MDKPTVVLVHGAFADAGSWDPVTRILRRRGFPVIAAANPLRGLGHDAAYVKSVLDGITGPVILAGHSYGGAVIGNAVTEAVTALVYVAAFAPDEGESAGQLDGRYGGPATEITLPRPFPGPAEPPSVELTVDPAKYHEMFAPDVDATTADALAAAQRPVALAALLEPSGPPGWKSLPSYYAVATADRMIPPAGQREMAARMGATTVEIEAGHAAMFGRPEAIADLITTAASR
ncbi:alpha/beta fold hydrolase [Amycolatopsis umgeniensis]|uniref:Pimeloyl-ACP methyl ester carboxylesterase n=1 Tax=Amycolatopsis umgeniensis TaxID=336628 RepID=A0A841AWR8_9PSEU|nr:alpha/beta hydrolase [Amycolatopsis umgeniensis]MBB5852306.1 pimeloyl-ACP methyl ester carboxylesterase [Amycolatopsis umgeniensis]